MCTLGIYILVLNNVTYFLINCQYLVLYLVFISLFFNKDKRSIRGPAALVFDMGKGIFVDFSRGFYLI